MRRILANRLGEFIKDRELIARLVADRRVYRAMTSGAGKVGEILLHGWGSPHSKRLALTVLLRHLLSGRVRDRAAVERFVTDRGLLRRILAGRGGDARVAAFLARHGNKGN